MKRFSKILLLMIGVIPFVAKADNYDYKFTATVTSDKGAKYCTDSKLTKECKTIDKDEKIVITRDIEGLYNIYIDNSYYYIDSKSFKPEEIADNYKYEKAEDYCGKIDECSERTVELKKDINLTTGPDQLFETITTVPKGTKLTYRYYFYEDGVEAFPSQIYVTYDGKSGWLDCHDDKVMILDSPLVYVNFSEVKTDNYTIPRFTYVLLKGYTINKYYLEYKETEIAIDYSRDKVWQAVKPSMVKAKKDIKVYDDTKKTKVVKTIKAGDKFTEITYSDSSSYSTHLVDYEGVKGFIFHTYAEEEDLLEFLEDEVDYESIGLAEYIELYDPTKWVIDNNSNNNSIEKKENNKNEATEEDKSNVKKVVITIISIASIIIIAGLVFVFKK